jgi:SAM-dependent methyltransferase
LREALRKSTNTSAHHTWQSFRNIKVMAAPRISEKALNGFAEAALYDQHRPSYPQEAVAKLLVAAGVNDIKDATVLDLAAGTGKLTELLAARDEQFNIIAVEPHSGMREQLERKRLKNVKVADGVSTSIPAEAQSIDAMFAAQVRFRHFAFPSFGSAFLCPSPLWLSPVMGVDIDPSSWKCPTASYHKNECDTVIR